MNRILFVGAPFGGFTRDVLPGFEQRGCRVWRVAFDGGDRMETPRRFRVAFPDRGGNWAAFVRQFIVGNRIDTVVVFNDCLPRQAAALRIAEQLGARTFAFENAYFRPTWVTLERGGINARSRLPRSIAFYRAEAARHPAQPPPRVARSHLTGLTRDTIAHYFWSYLLAPLIPFDSRAYGVSVGEQGRGYAATFLAGLLRNDRGVVPAIAAAKAAMPPGARVTAVLLQKPCDTQISMSSGFLGNCDFVREAITSFAAHAPRGSLLVVKEHPLDFGIERCAAFVAALAASFGIGDRVFFVRNIPIDRMMPLADAMVTINSTGGLAGLKAGIPVICLGRAFYDMAGLTFQGKLDAFWSTGERAAPEDVAAFRSYVVASAQVNGGFHSRAARAVLRETFVARVLSETPFAHERMSDPQRLAFGVVGAGNARHRAAEAARQTKR